MRRSRIKVMPSVPVRRKTAKDARDEKGGAESQKIFVPRVKEETKDDIMQAVDWPMYGNEFETDTARVSGASSVLERVEASKGERAAEQCESQAVRASSEESEDVATRRQPAQETAEPNGSGIPDHAPMAKQPSQTRTSYMPPTPQLDVPGSRILRNRVHGSGASACEAVDDCHRLEGPPNSNDALADRVRNDSVGSTYSPNRAATRRSNRRIVKQPPNVTTAAGTTPAKNTASAKSRRKQKIIVSESVRKLDRARREFRLKYKQNPPDRTKLTMYDLIHYNPVANPMKKTENADTPTSDAPSPTRLVVNDEDEKEDECDAGEVMAVPKLKVKPDECDAGEVMPVPQLKVKPDEYDAGEVTLVLKLKVETDECEAGEVMPVRQSRVKTDECETAEVMPVAQLMVEPEECAAGEVMPVRQLKVKTDECETGEVMPVPQLKVKPDEYDAGEVTLVLKLKVETDGCEAGEVMPMRQLNVKTDEFETGEVMPVAQLMVEPDECEAMEVMPVVQLMVEPDECEAVEVMPVAQLTFETGDPLVFDDRSLVVDHTTAQKSHHFEYDDSNGNASSKRGQTYRNWTKQDTLKFYKALNTIGTDFNLMQSLFPERSRKEIKMKYKKEDKLNRHKIEKALVHHQEFNIESLQQDLVAKKSQRR